MNVRRNFWRYGKAARFPSAMPGESAAVPAEVRGGLNLLQTSPPAVPESVQHNPQEPFAAVEAQATWRVLLENRKLVTKGEDLRLQRCTGPKTGGYQSEKGDEKRAHYGSHHDLTNDRNPCVFRSDGVSGIHSCLKRRASTTLPLLTAGRVIACLRVRSYGRKPLGYAQLDLDLPPARVARLVACGGSQNIFVSQLHADLFGAVPGGALIFYGGGAPARQIR